jgi:hypothetical protein
MKERGQFGRRVRFAATQLGYPETGDAVAREK